MKMNNFTVWFIIGVVIVGLLAIYVYEHFRYSPYSLLVDLGVIKEYVGDRHIDLADSQLRNDFRNLTAAFDKRMSAYNFALKIAPILSTLKDGVTRIEFPLKKKDGRLPLKFKYIDDEIIVVKSDCDVPVGAKVLTINGYPIEQIIDKYAELFPTLDEYKQRYSFVDKLLYTYPVIIDANSIQLTYLAPDSYAQRLSYVKAVEESIRYPMPISVFSRGRDTFVKVNTFSITDKREMQAVTEMLDEVAKTTSEGSRTFFDLRYADDGDDTMVTTILSHLIDEPKNLYPVLYRRYRDTTVVAEQMPIQPSEDKLKGDVYFLVDQSCFYPSQRTILFFLAENQIGIVLGRIDFSNPVVYTSEFWRILPNTRAYVVMPTEKAKISPEKWDSFLTENSSTSLLSDAVWVKLTKEALCSREKYEEYIEKFVREFDEEFHENNVAQQPIPTL